MTLFELVAQFEGCKLEAYLCPSGVPTIGFGSCYYADGSKVKLGDRITKEDAEILLRMKLDEFRSQVVRVVPGTLPAGAVDALTSFSYNCGTGALMRSTLLKKINNNKLDLKGIKGEFMKWTKSNGKELPGLVRRRRAEYDMYADAVLNQYSRFELLYMDPPK